MKKLASPISETELQAILDVYEDKSVFEEPIRGPSETSRPPFDDPSDEDTQDATAQAPQATKHPPYNIYEGLKHLDKIKMKHELAQNQITPFDKVEFIQALESPLRSDHYITVQLFKPSLRPSTSNLLDSSRIDSARVKAANYQPICLEDHPISEVVDNPVCIFCEFCLQQISGRAYTCGICSYFLCQPCNLKYFRRKNLVHQTSNHSLSEHFVLEAVTEETNDNQGAETDLGLEKQLTQQERLAKADQQRARRFGTLKRKAEKLSTILSKVCTSQPFANVVKSEMLQEQQLPGNKDFKKYVVVGLWKDCNGVFTCFRMFKIVNPVFQILKTSEHHEEREFLHFVSSTELMYFTNEYVVKNSGDSVIRCHLFDLQAAANGTGLTLLNEQLHSPPVRKEYVFEPGSQMNELLGRLLIQKNDRIKCEANLQTLTIQGIKMLVVTAEMAWALDQLKWVTTPFIDGCCTNILFFSLETQSLQFTVFHASLLLQVTAKTPPTLFVLRNHQIAQLAWGADVLTPHQNAAYLESVVPYQQTLKQFNFVAKPDRNNFFGLQQDLTNSLNACQNAHTLVRGEIHMEGKRVSINYLSGGIFTFQLEEKVLFSEPSVWQGEIGEIKDFEMINFTIINDVIKAEGEHSQGLNKFKVTGKKAQEKQEWKAYYRQGSHADQMILDRFNIDRNGIVEGSGEDSVGQFSIKGRLAIQDLKWVKHYHNAHSIYYMGKINTEHTSIKGVWGFREGESEDIFWMDLTQVSEMQLTISSETAHIQLNGLFYQSNAIFEGTFTCSQNLRPVWCSDSKHASKMKFKLMGHECQNRAVRLATSEDMRDARFTSFKDPATGLVKLGAIGNLRIQKDALNTGYQRALVDFMDLDDRMIASKQTIKILKINLPKTFLETKTDEVPYHLFMPFRMFDFQKMAFKTMMFYKDNILGGRRLCFVSVCAREEKIDYEPQCPSLMAESVMCSYPLLAYKSDLPSDQQLVVCNLAHNVPQQFINIQPFKFVQFLQTGLYPEQHFGSRDSVNNSIFFLVSLFQEDILDSSKAYKGDSYHVMCYRAFPWPVDMDKTDYYRNFYQFKPQLQLLSGRLELSKYTEFQASSLLYDKIMQASLLQRAQPDGVQVLVVLQLVNEVVCFNLMRDRHQRLNDDKDRMLKMHMVRGPQEQIYFAEEDQTGCHKMILLTFTEKDKVTKTAIFRSDSAKFLAYNVVYKNDDSPFVYILDSEKMVRRLNNKGVTEADFSVDLTLSVSQNPGANKLQSALTKTYWNSILFSEKVIIFLKQQDQSTVACIMSVRSELNVQMDTIGFLDDRNFLLKKQGRGSYREQQSAVLNLQSVPFCGMNLFQMQEGKNNFFLIQNELGDRKIDFMRVDTERCLREEFLLVGDYYIAVKFKGVRQYLLYSQETFDFVETLNVSMLKRLTPVVQGVQYFGCNDPELDQYRDQVANVFRVNSDGTRTTIYNNVYSNLCFVKHTLFQGQNINLQLEKLIMHANNEQLLGAIAWAESDVAIQLSPQQQTFKNGYLTVQVLMIQNIPALIEKHEMMEAMSPINKRSVGLMNSVKFSIKSLLGKYMHTAEYSPTVFVIKSDYWLGSTRSTEVIFTQDYFVIKYDMHVCFAKQSLIAQANNFGLVTAPRLDQLLKEGQGKVNFKLLNFEHVAGYLTKYDFKICEVQAYDLALAEKGEVRHNVIQISLTGLSIMWDLDEDKEVSFHQNPSDFDSISSYMPTGFVPYQQQDPSEPNVAQAVFFTQNGTRSLIMTSDLSGCPNYLFRTYSYINLLDVLFLKQQEQSLQPVNLLDLDTMFQNFEGLTFFQIFRTNEDYFEYLEAQVKELGSDSATDEFGQKSENLLIRKIYWTFTLPVIKEDMPPTAFQYLEGPSLLQATMFDEENQLILNNYLRLLKLSDEYRLSDLVANFRCFEQVFQIQSSQIQSFLQEAHFENSESKSCKSLKWNPEHQLITFGSNYSLLDKEGIQAEVREQQMKKLSLRDRIKLYFQPNTDILKDQLKTFSVTVRILEIEWVADNLLDFYYYLNGVTDNQMFGSEFIKILLEQQYYTNQLILKVFLPYLTNMILTLIYLSYFLPSVPVVDGFFSTEGHRTQAVLRCLIVIGDCFFIGVELRQLLRYGKDYFSDFWNLVFWISNFLSLFIIISHGTQTNQVELNTLIQLGSIQIVIQWAILYYWMRLFPGLAFYVTMISETIADIKNFLIMFLMCIGMFANAAYTLSLIQSTDEILNFQPNDPLWPKAFGVPFIDSFFNQYQIGIGAGSTDGYGGSPAAVLVFIYYILATIFTQIMFLNMLIAIMGETYSRVSEAKERSALMEQTHLYAEFMWGIRLSQELHGMRYLYVIRPNNEEECEASPLEDIQKRISELIKEQDARNASELAALQSKVQFIMQTHYELKLEMQLMKTSMDAKLDQILQRLK